MVATILNIFVSYRGYDSMHIMNFNARLWYTSQLIIKPRLKERMLQDMINTLGFMVWELSRITEDRPRYIEEILDSAIIHRYAIREHPDFYRRIIRILDRHTKDGFISNTLADNYRYLINCD